MKNKKISSIIIFLAVIILVVGFVVKNKLEEYNATTIEGTITDVNAGEIRLGELRVILSNKTVIVNADGKRIQTLHVGQNVTIKWNGDIIESNPPRIRNVYKVIVE